MNIQRSFQVSAVWKHKSESWIIEAANRMAAMEKGLSLVKEGGHVDIPQLLAHEVATFPGIENRAAGPERGEIMRNQNGYILVISMMLLLCLTLVGTAAILGATSEARLAGNQISSTQAFYAAEAGWNAIVGKMGTDIIDDKAPTQEWSHSLSGTAPDFESRIAHTGAVNKAGGATYAIKSIGSHSTGGRKSIEVIAYGPPSLDPPAAVYTKAPVEVKGSSTVIHGTDACGVNDHPGIITTTPTITLSGGPDINGIPTQVTNSPLSLPLPEMIEYLKTYATQTYVSNTPQTVSGGDWGTLNAGPPLSPAGPLSTVYFDMNGKELKLSGGSHGAGILLVDGDLEINGGFNWYGLIIVTGSLKYTGGGEKNITGGVMSGASASFDTTIGGNANILYCSTVKDMLKQLIAPIKVVAWMDPVMIN